jgi:death-on-curing protein
MITFLELNGTSIDYTDDDLIEIGLDLAAGNMTYEQLLKWIIDHAIE